MNRGEILIRLADELVEQIHLNDSMLEALTKVVKKNKPELLVMIETIRQHNEAKVARAYKVCHEEKQG